MYQYDVFLSYRREPPVSEWVANHFRDGLVDWLGETMADEPKVFVDVERIETGSAWPDVLRDALLGSRLMVSIWSPSYFRSPWCLAEYRTMQARERLLSLQGLVMPVRYHDGVNFPPEVQRVQARDFRAYNFPHVAFRETRQYLDFTRELQKFAEEIAARRTAAPPWQQGWPVELPGHVEPAALTEVPRL